MSIINIILIQVLILTLVHCIPDEEYYNILGVPIHADASDIKRAFRKLSKEKHPDKNPNAQEEYLKIIEAHDVLSDPDKRHMYDMYGKEGVQSFDKNQNSRQGGGGIFDMFGQFFGGSHGGHGHHNMQKTNDAVIELNVELSDFYLGNTRSITFQRNVICHQCRGTGAEGGETKTCPKCHGQGQILVEQNIMPGFRMQTQQTCPKCHGKGSIYKHQCPVCHGSGVHPQLTTIEVDIEKGMKNGQEIRFERKAEEKPGHIPGDVIVRLRQQSHQYFERDGDDLSTAVEITLTQALLGFDLNIEHMDGHWVNLQHDDVTSFGEIRNYKNEGMPHHNVPSDFGDLKIEYRVNFPDTLDDHQRQVIADLFDDEKDFSFKTEL